MRHPPARKTKDARVISVASPDWVNTLNYLLRQGYPKAQIAKAINCTRDAIYRIMGGAEPDWSVGEALRELHRREIVLGLLGDKNVEK